MASRIDFQRERIQEAIRDGVEVGITKVALSLQKRIRKNLSKPGTKPGPYSSKYRPSAPGKPPTVQTGNLRNSWIAAKKRGPVRFHKGVEIALRPGRVGSAPKYAWLLEYGTRKMKARPYIRPAVAQLNRGKRATRIVEAVLVKNIDVANRIVN